MSSQSARCETVVIDSTTSTGLMFQTFYRHRTPRARMWLNSFDQECIIAHPEESRVGVSRPTIKKVRSLNAYDETN